MALERHLSVHRTARYYSIGPEDGSARDVWFVLHGYGQLAAQFIEVFKVLDDGSRLIVAPEALNRFYLVGADNAPASERPVGATWMTREDRDHEIDDYVSYLDRVGSIVLDQFRARSTTPRIILLGFSQGTATATRWITRGTLRPAHVVLWSGFLPPEIVGSRDTAPLHGASLHVVIGARDRFVPAGRLANEERLLRDSGVPHRLVRYPGGHGIPKETLRELSQSLDGVPNELPA